jgi:benzoylformate decarboxylase
VREVFDELRRSCPANAILVEETPSKLADLHAAWPITQPDAFCTMASGGLGYGCYAVVGSEAAAAVDRNAPTVLEVPITATVPPLL